MNSVSELIPGVFYDLIGRVVPGALTLLLVIGATDTTVDDVVDRILGDASALPGAAVIVLAITLIAAYTTGHLLSPLSAALHRLVLARVFARRFSVLQAVVEGRVEYPKAHQTAIVESFYGLHGSDAAISAGAYRRTIYIWYDAVRIADPIRGTHLAKIRAEYRMLESTYTSMFIALAVHLGVSLFGLTELNIVLSLLLAVAVPYVASAAARMFESFQNAVLNSHVLVVALASA